jgi:signal peptidase complex subunit 1
MVDYEGQKLSELIFHVLIIAFGSVGWVIGYFKEDFTIVFQFWAVGVVLSVIVSFASCFARLLRVEMRRGSSI